MPDCHYTKPINSRFIDLTGHQYGRWIVIEYAGRVACGKHRWLCRCFCGNTRLVLGCHLRSGAISSCCEGWKRVSVLRTKHGEEGTRLYIAYHNMRSRCENIKNDNYKDYGGRGIFVCEEWRLGYTAFRDWALTNGYRDDLTIERKDVNGPYCPENCHWIYFYQQSINKRSTIYGTAFNETKPLSVWAKDPRCCVSYYTLHGRFMEYGWSLEKAIVTPSQRSKKCW